MTLQHYLRHRRIYEGLMWLGMVLINAVLTATSVIMERARLNNPVDAWEPFTWELSSGFVWLLLLAVLIAVDSRFPINTKNWRARTLQHLLGAIAFGLLHTLGFVAIRKAVYAALGGHYDFGNVPVEVFYELRKQLWSYAQCLAIIYAYRFILGRLRGEATIPQEDEDPTTEARPTRFLVKKLGREFLVKVDDIDWIEAAGNYVNLHVGARLYPLRSTMKGIESQLDEDRFIRVHRSAIVNVDRIAEIEPEPGGDAAITLTSGERLASSRTYRNRLRTQVSSVA